MCGVVLLKGGSDVVATRVTEPVIIKVPMPLPDAWQTRYRWIVLVGLSGANPDPVPDRQHGEGFCRDYCFFTEYFSEDSTSKDTYRNLFMTTW